MRDGRIDGVLGDVAFGPEVVMLFRNRANARLGQVASLHFHLVRGLPRSRNYFTDAAHGLRVRRHDADGPHVVKDVFRGNGFAANA